MVAFGLVAQDSGQPTKCRTVLCLQFHSLLCMPLAAFNTRPSIRRAPRARIRKGILMEPPRSQRSNPSRHQQVIGAGRAVLGLCVFLLGWTPFSRLCVFSRSAGSHTADGSVTWTGLLESRRKSVGIKVNWCLRFLFLLL